MIKFLKKAFHILPVLLLVQAQSAWAADPVLLNNPLTGNFSTITAGRLGGSIISVLISLAGALALVFFVIGGIVLMTSAGNEERVKRGRSMMVWSAIGLAVTLLSYVIVRFVFQAFGIL